MSNNSDQDYNHAYLWSIVYLWPIILVIPFVLYAEERNFNQDQGFSNFSRGCLPMIPQIKVAPFLVDSIF